MFLQVFWPVPRQEGPCRGCAEHETRWEESIHMASATRTVSSGPPIQRLSTFMAEETRWESGLSLRTVQRPSVMGQLPGFRSDCDCFRLLRQLSQEWHCGILSNVYVADNLTKLIMGLMIMVIKCSAWHRCVQGSLSAQSAELYCC